MSYLLFLIKGHLGHIMFPSNLNLTGRTSATVLLQKFTVNFESLIKWEKRFGTGESYFSAWFHLKC